jgi:hypothetical protein
MDRQLRNVKMIAFYSVLSDAGCRFVPETSSDKDDCPANIAGATCCTKMKD